MNLRDGRVWLMALFLLHFTVHQVSFHAVYLDSDQLVIADQAAWMARGEFFEPFFFGQAYLLPFESYLAIPLIWLGLSPVFAVKLIAALAFYAPFAWTAWTLGKDRLWAAVCVTLLFFLLPLEFLLAGAMPRGFIVATALAWLGLRALLRAGAQASVTSLSWAALVGFCLGSYMSVALMLPALVLMVDDRRRALLAILGLALGLALFKGVGLFYSFNPGYIVHRFPKLRFSSEHFMGHLTHPQIAIAFGTLILLTLVACLGALAVRGQTREWRFPFSGRHMLVALGLLTGIGVMLATNKIADFDPGTPFFSVYRMLLPLPLLALLVISHAAQSAAPWPETVRVPAGAWIAAALMLAQLGWQAHLLPRDRRALALLPSSAPTVSYEKLERQCGRLGEAIRSAGQRYYSFRGRNDALAYGCHAEFGVPVVQRDYERRTWLREHLEQATQP